MNFVQAASHPLPRWIADAFRTWAWRHTALGVGLGALNIAFGQNGGMLVLPDFIEKHYLSAFLYNVFKFGLPFVFAVRVADRAVDGGVRAISAYGAAVVLVAAGGTWMAWLFNVIVDGEVWSHAANARLALAVGVLYALGVAAYAHDRRACLSLARVRALEADRANQIQLLQTSRLFALQARVEPQLLFATLRKVSDLVACDVAAADALLNDMISLLRAVVPSPGKTSTTVAEEYALASAYARVRQRIDGREASAPPLRLNATPEVAATRITPMLLLPTLRAISSATDDEQVTWNVGASRDGERLAIRIAGSASETTVRRAIEAIDFASIRECLASAHGDSASLRLAETPSPTPTPMILLNLPIIHDDRADR